MRDNNGMSPPPDRLAKHFPWMHHNRSDTALRNGNRFADRMKIRINRQHKKVLLLRCFRNNLQEHLGGRRRRTHGEHSRFVALPGILQTPRQRECRGNLQELRLAKPLYGFRGTILIVFLYAYLDCTPIRNYCGIPPRRIQRHPQPPRQFGNLAPLRSCPQDKTEEFFIGHLIDRCHCPHFLTRLNAHITRTVLQAALHTRHYLHPNAIPLPRDTLPNSCR